jgi:hypothetical protein
MCCTAAVRSDNKVKCLAKSCRFDVAPVITMKPGFDDQSSIGLHNALG